MRWVTVFLVVLILPLSVLAQGYRQKREIKPADIRYLKDKYVDLKVLVRGSTTNNPTTYFEAKGSRFYFTTSYRVRKDEPVIITDIKPKDDSFEVSFVSSRLGKASVVFSSHLGSPVIDFRAFEYGFRICFDPSDEMEFPLVHKLSETPPVEYPTFVGNNESNLFHVAGSNHLPDLEHRQSFNNEKDAENAGMKRCRLCFLQQPLVSDFHLERRLGLYVSGQAKMHSQLVVNQDLQEKTEEIGRRVLRNWPVGLKGYDYHFYLLEDYEFNAFAAPTGFVFVNRGLMEIAESEREIESVLAHEIAHVEMRHGYRIYRKAQGNAALAAGLSLVVGAAVGILTNDKNDAVIMGGLSALISQQVLNAFYSGYSRSMEEDADTLASLYLTLRYGERGGKAMSLALRKLQYYDDYLGRNPKDLGAFASHPMLANRIAAFSRPNIQIFDTPFTIVGMTQSGDTAVTIKLIAQRIMYSPIGSPAPPDPINILGQISATPDIKTPRKFSGITITRTDGMISKLENRADSLVGPYEEEGFLLRGNLGLSNKEIKKITVILEGTDYNWAISHDDK